MAPVSFAEWAELTVCENLRNIAVAFVRRQFESGHAVVRHSIGVSPFSKERLDYTEVALSSSPHQSCSAICRLGIYIGPFCEQYLHYCNVAVHGEFISAVQLSRSLAFASAPAASKACTTSGWPF